MPDSFFQIFLINHVSDTLILFLVRQKLYPEKNIFRIMLGGWIAAVTYMIWNSIYPVFAWKYAGNTGAIAMNITALLIVFLLLISVFRLRSFFLFMRTLIHTLLYASVLGGIGHLVKRILPPSFPFHSLSVLVFSIMLCMLFSPVLVGNGRRHQTEKDNLYLVEIKLGERSIRCIGLYDSGNLLTSQITGEGICVMAGKEGEILLKEKENNMDPEAMFHYGSGVYPIEYRSVGRERGIMPGILVDHIIISKNRKVLVDKMGMVGICKEKISKDERFSVLLPEDIFS